MYVWGNISSIQENEYQFDQLNTVRELELIKTNEALAADAGVCSRELLSGDCSFQKRSEGSNQVYCWYLWNRVVCALCWAYPTYQRGKW